MPSQILRPFHEQKDLFTAEDQEFGAGWLPGIWARKPNGGPTMVVRKPKQYILSLWGPIRGNILYTEDSVFYAGKNQSTYY